MMICTITFQKGLAILSMMLIHALLLPSERVVVADHAVSFAAMREMMSI